MSTRLPWHHGNGELLGVFSHSLLEAQATSSKKSCLLLFFLLVFSFCLFVFWGVIFAQANISNTCYTRSQELNNKMKYLTHFTFHKKTFCSTSNTKACSHNVTHQDSSWISYNTVPLWLLQVGVSLRVL